MKSPLPHVLRLVAVLLAVAGVALGAVDAFAKARSHTSLDQSIASQLPGVVQAVGMALGLLGLGALLWGVAALLEEKLSAEQKKSDPILAKIKQLVESTWIAINQMSADKMPREEPAAVPTPNWESSAPPIAAPMTAPAPVTHPSVAMDTSTSMKHIVSMLEEIRELALLNDAQRQQRLVDTQQQRRAILTAEADQHLLKGSWGEAEKVVAIFAGEFPRDPAVRELKTRLVEGRKQAEEISINRLRERIEDLIAIANWGQAYDETIAFCENFPQNVEGQQLLERVTHESNAYVEVNANRLYEDIRQDIDHRHWRRALKNAMKLMEQFPGHRRSATIRSQLKTIQENAEIEERQETERQIQELIRAKQFPKAIELAEDLIERFPDSPQADSLERLLPKMEQLAIESEIGTEAD